MSKRVTIKVIAFVEDTDDPLDMKLYIKHRQISTITLDHAIVGKQKYLSYAIETLADDVIHKMLKDGVI